ncbi:MAG: sporulation protein YqfD [Lachnospiraceae bacterium]
MIGILKFLRGFVQIKVWGFAPERFLNLCSNKNILLWDIKKDGDIYYMSISLSGFKKLKGIARKTRVRVVILKRCGLPFLLPKILEKKIFIAGLMLACFFWYWSSLYVWEITIEGNTAITEDMFSDFLKEHGVYVGIKSSKVDIEQLEKDIRKEFGEITWTSAKLSGTELIISVKENDAILEPVQEMGSADLYAPKEGIIVEMIVRSGVPQVKIGDTIEAGCMLVSGSIPVYNEDGTVRNYQYTHADADIYVERKEPVYIELPFTYMKKVYTGRETKQYYIEVGGREFIFGGNKEYLYSDTVANYKQLSPLKGLVLPFSFGTYIRREYQNTECEYTLSEAEKQLSEKYSAFLADLEEKGVQIIEKNVKIDTGSSMWILQGELIVKEKIGEAVPITETEPAEEGMQEAESADSE